MKLGRVSLGLAVRTAREAAKLTLNDLAVATGLTQSSLSRSEIGQRDLTFNEVLAIAEVIKIGVSELRDLAETFERSGVAEKANKRDQLAHDLSELQRAALEGIIDARNS